MLEEFVNLEKAIEITEVTDSTIRRHIKKERKKVIGQGESVPTVTSLDDYAVGRHNIVKLTSPDNPETIYKWFLRRDWLCQLYPSAKRNDYAVSRQEGSGDQVVPTQVPPPTPSGEYVTPSQILASEQVATRQTQGGDQAVGRQEPSSGAGGRVLELALTNLEKENAVLTERLARQDQQIKDKHEQVVEQIRQLKEKDVRIKEKDEQLEQRAVKMEELLKEANSLASQAQTLRALEIKSEEGKQKQLSDDSKKPVAYEMADSENQASEEQGSKEKRKKWWQL